MTPPNADYFDSLYADNADPWQYETRWYEQRKRAMCLAVLPQKSYAAAIELGCGNGVFSQFLASRCQTLTSLDGNANAVQLARERLQSVPNVTVIQGMIPDALPAQPYDLIVISEILYYLPPAALQAVITWITTALNPHGTLLCCHWQYPIAGFELTGKVVHRQLQAAFAKDNTGNSANNNHGNFLHQTQIIDADFLLDVWQAGQTTVAMQENLV